MKAMVFIFGLLGAIFAGAAAALLLGQTVGFVILAVLLVVAIAGFFVARDVARILLIVGVVALVVGIGVTGWAAYTIYQAVSDTEGPVAAPDPASLASAEQKVDAIEDSVAFRLELTEAEMTAYVLDGLADNEDNPLGNVVLDVVDPAGVDEQGLITFTAEFKSGGVEADGAVSAQLDNGAVKIVLEDIEMGAFQLPGIAEGALEDLVESVADLNEALEEHRASVQEITIGNDRVVVVGTQAGTDLISAQDLLEGLRESAEEAIDAVQPPAERLGPGVVNSTSAGSGPFYVALGDSLAANVGVSEPRDGYVARFHNQLQIRDGQEYGLRNFGISGETTGTLIRSGQLDDAIAFMNDNEVAYVTIDIGANNLLGHLGSPDCSESLEEVACQQRLASTFDSYDDDLALILDEIQDAAPDATVMFVLAYNPFSLGFAAVGLEEQSDAILRQFNSIAVAEAEARGFIVADTQTPMEGTTAATTHMVDPEPDIHPYPIGFDIMASAMVDALP